MKLRTMILKVQSFVADIDATNIETKVNDTIDCGKKTIKKGINKIKDLY